MRNPNKGNLLNNSIEIYIRIVYFFLEKNKKSYSTRHFYNILTTNFKWPTINSRYKSDVHGRPKL